MAHYSDPFLIFLFVLSYLVLTRFQRLYLHKLSKFPGPKLAACTTLYRLYYDVVLGGRWLEHLSALHQEYGAIVRVGPNELHFSDPDAYGDIYNANNKFTKDPKLYKTFSPQPSVFSHLDPQEAHKIRNVLAPYFSRRSILKFEEVIQKTVDKLISKLTEYDATKRSANLHHAFRSTTLDIITSYCFAQSSDTLDTQDFRHGLIAGVEPTFRTLWITKHFPLIRKIIFSLPYAVAVRVSPPAKAILDHHARMYTHIDQLLAHPEALDDANHQTIYHGLLEYHLNAGKDLREVRRELHGEGINLRFAGSDTVGNACTVGTTYVLRDRNVRERLVMELKERWPDLAVPMKYDALEKLPYLTAVIKESLRLGHGVVTPLDRVVGMNGARIADVYVPEGTIVGMGHTFVHLNPDIFPNPVAFLPERWLEADSSKLEKHLVAFSRGPRNCLGMNLAWCELYLILGNVFRKLDLVEDETIQADLRFVEYFSPLYLGNKLHAIVQLQKL